MEVLICFDHGFVMPCEVMLRSLVENNQEEPIHCHALIDNTISVKDEYSLREIVGSNNTISFYHIDNSVLEEFPQPVIRKYSKMTFCRLLASTILPSHIDKVLYLDGDVVVCKSLQELWRMDISDVAIAAALDVNQSYENFYRMHLKCCKGYVNTGVLLINLKWWRENGIQDKFINYINNSTSKQLKYCDQDVLNFVLQDKKQLLPIKYNTLSGFYGDMSRTPFPFYDYESEVNKALTSPVILHFTGRVRPWNKGCTHPLRSVFEKYYMQTRWANIPFKRKKESLKWYIRHIIVNIFNLIIHT